MYAHDDTDCVTQQTVIEVTWSNFPEGIKKEVHQLWMDAGFGNDNYYYSWDESEIADHEYEGESYPYPKLAEYLKNRDVKKCLIHFWW